MARLIMRPIKDLTKEKLFMGLPMPWLLTTFLLESVLLFLRFPSDYTAIPGLVVMGGGLWFGMMAVYRLSKAKIIVPWLKWHVMGESGYAGHDPYPIPSRYEAITDRELDYLEAHQDYLEEARAREQAARQPSRRTPALKRP